MIRMIFAVVLTVGALVGLSLRLQRDGTLPAPVERLRAEVRTLDLAGVVSAALKEVGASEVLGARAPESPQASAGASSPPSPTHAVEVPREELPAPVMEEEVAEEVVLARSQPFVEAPPHEHSGSGGNHEPHPEQPRPTIVASSVDQDAWAKLIRRMLHVRRSSESR